MIVAHSSPATAPQPAPSAREEIPSAKSPRTGELRLAELLGALSYALDMTEGQPPGHCVRCCWIGVHIGQAFGLADAELSNLYYTLLLKDLGCSSNAARICQLYMADDLTFKRDFKQVSDSLPQVLRFVLSHTGLQAGLAERFRAIMNIVQNGGQIARELVETRCNRGADIARQMRFSDEVAAGIRDLDEHWDGGGKPSGLAGAQISPLAQIALMAQVVDVFQTSAGIAQAIAEIRHRSGAWFDPRLVAAFEWVASDAAFWTILRSSDVDSAVFALRPGQRSEVVDEDYLDDIAFAFAGVVDAKTPFTNGHSERVALFTDLIAKEMGCDPAHRRWLKRAALLHDIGKLGVSNTILDKPGKLDAAEWVAVRAHPTLGETILSRIAAFAPLARIAGAHHERLDGKGYPRGLPEAEIDRDTRMITTADIFDALTAERPYRGPIPLAEALAIMAKDVGAVLDPDCFEALRRAVAVDSAQAAP